MSDVSVSELSLQDAQNLYRAGRLPEAARLYHEFLRTNPRHHEALNTLAVIYFRTQQYEQAQYLFGEALRLDAYDTNSMCFRGLSLLQLKRYDAAIECFDRALAINPDFIEAIVNRATALSEMARYDEAVAAFENVLARDPNHAVTWNNLGNALLELTRTDDAAKAYDLALALMPEFPEAQSNRRRALGLLRGSNAQYADLALAKGVLLMREGRFNEAIASFDEAIAIKPHSVDALSSRATALLELKRFDEALAGFDAALALDPSHAISWNNRGNVLAATRRLEEALEHYNRALSHNPEFAQASDNRMNVLFELRCAKRCPPGYMRGLFDDFASHYDETMLEKLQYRGHEHLREMAEHVLERRSPPWRILDLGSGTGLVGETFRDLAVGGRLDGVDLSPMMIEAARRRGIYDDLILGDIETVLHLPGPTYDLILAADTMIYIGDVSPTFSGVAKRLEPGGFFIFAVESGSGEGWEQTDANRFVHGAAYLKNEAAQAGLKFVDIIERPLRNQGGIPVPGFVVALEKPGA